MLTQIIAVLAVLLAPSLAIAVTFAPVPWLSASSGDSSPPRLFPGLRIYCETGSGGCADTTGARDANYQLAGPQIQIDTGPLQFSADLVSEATGNAWTFGYRNAQLVTPPPTGGSVVGPNELAVFSLDFEFGVLASLDVPGSGLTNLVFGASALGAREGLLESAMFGFGRLPTIGTTEQFFAGDQLTMYSSAAMGINISSAPNNQIGAIDQSTFSSCGRQLATLDLGDCLITISVFQVVPEPALPGLVLASAAGLALFSKRS